MGSIHSQGSGITMRSVLFLCTGNSCRSQMAEGWCRHLFPELTAASAGVIASQLNPLAVKVMAEAGVDISTQKSEQLDDYLARHFDLVVTVCDNARESCPVFPNASRVIHHSFDDPPALAEREPNESLKLTHYRRVRDEIELFLRRLVEENR